MEGGGGGAERSRTLPPHGQRCLQATAAAANLCTGAPAGSDAEGALAARQAAVHIVASIGGDILRVCNSRGARWVAGTEGGGLCGRSKRISIRSHAI